MRRGGAVRTVENSTAHRALSSETASAPSKNEPFCKGALNVWVCSVVAIFVAVLVASFQSGFFSAVRPFGKAPDLCLAFSVASGMLFGARFGAVSGVAVGFFIDALSVGGLSLNIPFYFICGAVSGILALPEIRPFRDILRYLATLSSACLAKQILLSLWVVLTSPSIDVGSIVLELILLELLCTTVFSFIVYLPASGIFVLRARRASKGRR